MYVENFVDFQQKKKSVANTQHAFSTSKLTRQLKISDNEMQCVICKDTNHLLLFSLPKLLDLLPLFIQFIFSAKKWLHKKETQ